MSPIPSSPRGAVAAPPDSAVEAAPAESEFDALVGRYRRELLAHCYRMVGSPSEAEDLVQETYLRAWRSYATFEGRSSLRTWLHRIATNVCLTSLEGRDRRPLPTGLGAPSLPADAPLVEREIPWLGPLPDAMLGPSDPAEVAAQQDHVRLAFVAALQHLPARQRAVLVLRDVLRWSARETAEALSTSVPAVNSALQRAHATLDRVAPDADAPSGAELTPRQRKLLDAYVQAFWRKDVDAVAALLTHDAVWEMPPWEGWYQGPDTIARLVDTQCPGGSYDMPLLATSCNGQPAFGLYMRESCALGPSTVPGRPEGGRDDLFVPFQLHVLTLGSEPTASGPAEDRVEHVVAFFGPEFFERAHLPRSLSAADVAALAPLPEG